MQVQHQVAEPLWLLCSTGLGHEDAKSSRICRRRRAPAGSGWPSMCHGCAVACSGQPPPPSAPGPVVRWRAKLLSRGCGGRARVPVDRGEVSPKFPRAAARPAEYSGLNLVGLLISFSIHQRMPLFCVDPLRCSGFDRPKVHLY